MRRLVFLDPPSPPGRVAFRDHHGGFGEMCLASRLRVPTLDVFHSAAWAAREGAWARVVDSVVREHRPEEAAAAVAALRPDLVAVRAASESLEHDLACGLRAKAASGARLVLFGPQAALERARALEAGADAVVVGEAPPVFAAVARRGLRAMTGLALPGARDPRPALLADVDRLPVPRWDLVDWRRYSHVTTQTAWGCPVGCGYCPYPVTQGRAVRARSSASVVSEFRLLRRWKIPFVLCRDPFFTVERRRALALCAALERAGTPILWGCETRLEALDAALVDAMARAGCIRVEFAVESLSARVLRAAGRAPMTPEAVREKTALLKSRGMLTYALYMLGLPGETADEARATVDFALSLGTDAAAFSCAAPFPGTALAEEARARGLLRGHPLRMSAASAAMASGPMSVETVHRLRQEAKRRWSERPRPSPSPVRP